MMSGSNGHTCSEFVNSLFGAPNFGFIEASRRYALGATSPMEQMHLAGMRLTRTSCAPVWSAWLDGSVDGIRGHRRRWCGFFRRRQGGTDLLGDFHTS
jgi:hypothetical protein